MADKIVNPPAEKPPRPKQAWNEKVDGASGRRAIRETILFETAARMFNSYGFHGTSMSQLTQELGLSKGALYYYVEDKSDLLYKLHIKSAEATRNAYEAGVAEGRNGYERVRSIIRHYIAAVTASPTETFILLEKDVLNPEQTEDIVQRRKQLELDLRSQITKGIDDGSIVPCDPKLATFMLVGAMAWVSKWFEPGRDWTPDQIAHAMADMLMRAIAATPCDVLVGDVAEG
jgi:TetR/AcrR family transcriptional regulator